MFVIVFLAGCGGKENYVSVDKSADYKSAQSRPPLRKPNNPSVVPEPVSSEIQSENTMEIKASLLDGENIRLQFNTDMNQSWAFLSKKLIGQGITIFERNETARYFVVACSDVGILETAKQGQPVENSRWVIFRQEVEKESDNCSIRLLRQKDNVVAAVYNQYGQVVNTESVRQLFIQLSS